MTLNFLALFIVTPNISSMPEIYGVYSMCVGLNVFLQYADLGFIKAGKKFAAECISTGDIDTERKYVGTSLLIYIVVCIILLLGASLCIVYPELVIKGVRNSSDTLLISRKLLFVFTLSIPITILEKFTSFIYSIRLEEFRIQRILIFGSIIKIASVPLVFFNEKYDIVGYYLFTQLVQLLCFTYILYISKRIGYGFLCFFKIMKYDRQTFINMKGLAFSGFVASLSWILFYEIDTIAISAVLGAGAVAIYAIGRTLQTYLRTIVSILYSPYDVRFNHFVGSGDTRGFLNFFSFIDSIYSVVIIPIVIVAIFAEPFVLSWVGTEYNDSILLTQLLVFCFGLNAISNPCTSIIYSHNRVKELFWISIFQPLVFWLGIYLSISTFGVDSFAIFKLLSCIIVALYSYYVAKKVVNINSYEVLVENYLWPLMLSCGSSYIVYHVHGMYFTIQEKSFENLLYTLIFMLVAGVVSLITFMCFRSQFRNNVKQILNNKKL